MFYTQIIYYDCLKICSAQIQHNGISTGYNIVWVSIYIMYVLRNDNNNYFMYLYIPTVMFTYITKFYFCRRQIHKTKKSCVCWKFVVHNSQFFLWENCLIFYSTENYKFFMYIRKIAFYNFPFLFFFVPINMMKYIYVIVQQQYVVYIIIHLNELKIHCSQFLACGKIEKFSDKLYI